MSQETSTEQRGATVPIPAATGFAYASVATAAVLFGVAGAISKFLFNQNISPISLTIIRTIAAAAIFLVLFRFSRGWRALARDDVGIIALIGFLTFSVTYTFYRAIDEAGAAVAIMLQYTAPVFVIVFELVMRGVRITRAKSIALVLSTLGCLFLVGGQDLHTDRATSYGIVFGLACGALFALYNISVNRAHERGLSERYITAHSFSFAAVFAACAAPSTQFSLGAFGSREWLAIVFIAVFATVIPYRLYVTGLKNVPAFQATLVGMLDPVSAAIFAAMFLGENLNLLQILGIVAILTGVVFSTQRGGVVSA